MATFHDPRGLDGLALRDGANLRSPLLQALVDLYLQKRVHSPDEERHFTELVLRLLDKSNDVMRANVARRLATYPATPPAVIERIAPYLSGSTGNIVEPASVVGQAPAAAALRYGPPSAAELAELFFTADAAERRLILMNLGFASPARAATIAWDKAEAIRQLETAALAHQLDAFMRGLETWLGIAPASAYRIVHDPLGEPIVVVAKVLGMRPDALQRILLFLNPLIGRSVARVFELAALFGDIGTDAAHTLVAIWRQADPAIRRHDRENAAQPDPRLRESTRRDRSRSRALTEPRRRVPPRARASDSA